MSVLLLPIPFMEVQVIGWKCCKGMLSTFRKVLLLTQMDL